MIVGCAAVCPVMWCSRFDRCRFPTTLLTYARYDPTLRKALPFRIPDVQTFCYGAPAPRLLPRVTALNSRWEPAVALPTTTDRTILPVPYTEGARCGGFDFPVVTVAFTVYPLTIPRPQTVVSDISMQHIARAAAHGRRTRNTAFAGARARTRTRCGGRGNFAARLRCQLRAAQRSTVVLSRFPPLPHRSALLACVTHAPHYHGYALTFISFSTPDKLPPTRYVAATTYYPHHRSTLYPDRIPLRVCIPPTVWAFCLLLTQRFFGSHGYALPHYHAGRPHGSHRLLYRVGSHRLHYFLWLDFPPRFARPPLRSLLVHPPVALKR